MRRWIGPGVLVAVGYMDPGNWATGIEAGSGYGYSLAWVILVSSTAAILLQIIAARLGVCTQMDLVGLGYRFLGARMGKFLAFTAFIAVIATDLAEVLGFSLALRLLTGLPMSVGAVLALVEVVFILYWTSRRPRALESLVGILTLAIVFIFIFELFLLRPPFFSIVEGLKPSALVLKEKEALYLTLGLIGATIMPHNLYLHSAWIRKRFSGDIYSQTQAITRDTTSSLSLAFFVNIALLITAAALRGTPNPLERWGIEEAYRLFEPALGTAAMAAFGVALLLSGHNATLTSTLTGQIVLEYLLPRRLSPTLRSLALRTLSLLPALLALSLWGEKHVSDLLVLSQVILSLQLPFVLLPMLYFLHKVPQASPSRLALILTYVISISLIALNSYLFVTL
ncbi:MAG: Nramp family divalent metal transporter [Bacteroidia bacterium]|nr:Nramp family divalent metal transporter [Bacteroidia bacterium]